MYGDIYIYKPIGTRDDDDDDDVITAGDILSQLDWCDGDSVTVHVNCPGGSYFEGLAIFQALNTCDKRVIVKVEGVAASMASIFILAADEIVMSPFARIMTHCIQGQSNGNAAQLRADANEMETFEGSMLNIYSLRTGLTPEECRVKFMADTDTWFTAEEAIAAKLADRIEMGKLSSSIQTGLNPSLQSLYQSLAAVLIVPNHSKDMDFLKIKNQFHLSDDITEDAFLGQVEGWRTKANEVDQLTAQLDSFKNAAALAETARVDGLIAQAVNDKRIVASQKEMWKSLFAANAENAEKALLGIAPAKNLANITGSTGTPSEREELEKLSFDQLDRGNKLEHVRAQYYDLYEAKFEQKFGKKPASK